MARKTDIIDLTKLKPRACGALKTFSSDSQDISKVWDRFDKIVCVHYLPYKERFQAIKDELQRIGVLNLPQFEWFFTVSNPYYREILGTESVDKQYVKEHNINYTVDSLNLMIRFHELGLNSVLLIEDDVQFIDNVNVIARYVGAMPSDFDFVNLDPWYWSEDRRKVKEQMRYLKMKNERGILFDKFNVLPDGLSLFQTSFIAFSGRMIDHVIQNDFVQLKPFDHYFINRGTSDENFNRYVSTMNIGRQKFYEIAQDPITNRYVQ